MLKIFGQFAVKLAELAEAEGRLARRHVSQFALVAAIMLLAVGLLFIAILLLAAATYFALVQVVPQAVALLIIGLILLAMAGIAAAAAARAQKQSR